MGACNLNVYIDGCWFWIPVRLNHSTKLRKRGKSITYGWIRHNDHDVGLGCEHINKSSKIVVANFHTLKLCCGLATRSINTLNNQRKWVFFPFFFFFFLLCVWTKQKEVQVPATQFELFDYVAYLFKSMYVRVRSGVGMCNNLKATIRLTQRQQYTRNVALSNRTTSSASQTLQKLFNCFSITWVLGIRE